MNSCVFRRMSTRVNLPSVGVAAIKAALKIKIFFFYADAK